MSRWACFWTACATYAVAVGAGWWFAPDVVPLHFGLSGQADRMGGSGRLLATFGVLGVVMLALFVVLARGMRRMPLELVNLPARTKDWWIATEERRQRLRALVSEDVLLVGAVTFAFLAVVAMLSWIAAHRQPPALGWELPVALLAYVAVLGGYARHALRDRYRPGAA